MRGRRLLAPSRAVSAATPNPSLLNCFERSLLDGIDTDGSEYTATITNDGHAGNIRAELFFLADAGTPNPAESEEYGGAEPLGITFAGATEETFDEDETQTLTIAPDDVEQGEEYGIQPFPATFGGIIENEGGSGDVEVFFSVDETDHEFVEPDPKTVSLESDEVREVAFDVVIPMDAAFEVAVELS